MSDLTELDSDLETKPTVTALGQISSESVTVTLVGGHIYFLATMHPYSAVQTFYLILGYGDGSQRLTPILSSNNITVTLDGLALTVTSTATAWPVLVDLGNCS